MDIRFESKENTNNRIEDLETLFQTASRILEKSPRLQPESSHTLLRRRALIRDAVFKAIESGNTSDQFVERRLNETIIPVDDSKEPINGNVKLRPQNTSSESEKKEGIKKTIRDLCSENESDKQRAACEIFRFIHFYIRKIRHQNPGKYMRNGKTNPNGLKEYEVEDLSQYIFTHILMNLGKIDFKYDPPQIKMYLNELIKRAYYKWMHEQRMPVKPPDKYKNGQNGRAFKQYYYSLNDENLTGLEMTESSGTPHAEFESKESRNAFDEILKSLPDKNRKVLKKRIVDGMIFKDIGTDLGISPQRAKQIYDKTLTQLSNNGPAAKGYKAAKNSFGKLKEVLL
jgi:RNA polymerase sigma factor (sigma-70 family)